MTLTKKSDFVVYRKEGMYIAFPNILRLPDGRIMVSFRQAKDRRAEYGFTTHTDITAKGVCVFSADNGNTWDAEASEMCDFPLGGINENNITLLSDGTILGVFYRWRAFMASDAGTIYPWDVTERVKGWTFVWRLDGTYTIRSKDGGRTWDDPIKVVYTDVPMEIHSRGKAVEMPDGSLLLPVNGSTPFFRSNRVFSSIVRSEDCGRTWQPYADIAQSDTVNFYETTIYRSSAGRFSAFLRGIGRGDQTDANLYLSFSDDEGKSWSEAARAPFTTSSTVFDVIALPDNRALLTYGYRLEPFGIRARVLDRDCRNVAESEEVVLRDDGLGRDIGYSSSALIGSNEVLVVYYYYHEDGVRHIAGSLCSF